MAGLRATSVDFAYCSPSIRSTFVSSMMTRVVGRPTRSLSGV